MRWIKLSSATALSFALVAVFCLHSVEFKHEHNSVSHTHQHHSDTSAFDIDEYFHGTEQKFFLIIVLALLALGLFSLQKPWVIEYKRLNTNDFYYPAQLNKFFDHETNFLKRLFRKGILNPKLH